MYLFLFPRNNWGPPLAPGIPGYCGGSSGRSPVQRDRGAWVKSSLARWMKLDSPARLLNLIGWLQWLNRIHNYSLSCFSQLYSLSKGDSTTALGKKLRVWNNNCESKGLKLLLPAQTEVHYWPFWQRIYQRQGERKRIAERNPELNNLNIYICAYHM